MLLHSDPVAEQKVIRRTIRSRIKQEKLADFPPRAWPGYCDARLREERIAERGMGLRILLIDEDQARAEALLQSLAGAGYETVGVIDPKDDLVAKVRDLAPDLIIVDMESPSRDTLEDMRRITADRPRPIVMFVDESDETAIA